MKARIHFLVVFGVLAFHLLAARGDEVTYTRQVLLPDGTPAAGAQVMVRRPSPEGISWLESPLWTDEFLRTDDNGILRVRSSNPFMIGNGFVMVDVPGYALAFWTYSYQQSEPWRLRANFPIRGQALDERGKPVAGAVIAARRIFKPNSSRWLLNDLRQVRLPQLVTISDHQGRFVLRGVSRDGGVSKQSALDVVVRAQRAGRDLLGEAVITISPTESGTPSPPGQTSVILKPPTSISGRALNPLTGEPVAGITITLYPSRSQGASPAPLITGQDGRFQFQTDSQAAEWSLSTSHPRFTRASAHIDNPTPAPGAIFNIDLWLRPTSNLSGIVVDAETGEILPASVVVSAGAPDRKITARPLLTVEGGAFSRTDEAGRFQMQAGQGRLELGVNATFHLTFGDDSGLVTAAAYRLEEPKEIIVGPDGIDDLTVKVRKNPGVLVRFDTSLYSSNEYLTIEAKVEGKVEKHGFGSVFFHPVAQWGQTIQLRVVDFGKEIVPWTELTADPKNWPHIIRVPQ